MTDPLQLPTVTRAPALVLASTLLLSVVGAPARADYRSSFRDGLRAFQQERFEQAAVELRRALAQRPVAEAQKIAVGRERISYVPNTVLAITLVRLGRCDQALPYFQTSNSQGVAARETPALHRLMQEAQSECASNAAGRLVEAAEGALVEAQEIATGIASVLARPATANLLRDRAEVERRAKRADEMMANAGSLLEAGRRSNWFQALGDAAQTAQTARDSLVALREDIQSELLAAVGPLLEAANTGVENAERSRQQARADLDEVTGSAKGALEQRYTAADQKLSATSTALAEARQKRDPTLLATFEAQSREAANELAAVSREARAAVDRAIAKLPPAATMDPPARDTSKTAAATPTPTATSESPAAESELPATTPGRRSTDPAQQDRAQRDAGSAAPAAPATQPPSTRSVALALDPGTGLPKALVEGAQDYFSGDYAMALERLREIAADNSPAGVQAALLRAAASFALFRLGGEADSSLLDSARREIALAKSAQPTLEIQESYFPPSFIALVKGVSADP